MQRSHHLHPPLHLRKLWHAVLRVRSRPCRTVRTSQLAPARSTLSQCLLKHCAPLNQLPQQFPLASIPFMWTRLQLCSLNSAQRLVHLVHLAHRTHSGVLTRLRSSSRHLFPHPVLQDNCLPLPRRRLLHQRVYSRMNPSLAQELFVVLDSPPSLLKNGHSHPVYMRQCYRPRPCQLKALTPL